jgi:hypothetical protein
MKTTKEVSTDALASARRDGGDTPTVKIKAIITLHANGKVYAPGSLVDLADEEAQRLLSRGFAESEEQEIVPHSPTPQGQSSPHQAVPTIEDIVDAISALDPAKDFGKNGKPNVDALEDLLDANITAAQRDEAWEIYQKEQAEENGGAE